MQGHRTGTVWGPAAPWDCVLSPCVTVSVWTPIAKRCSAFCPFPFSFAHVMAAAQELVSDICRTMAC